MRDQKELDHDDAPHHAHDARPQRSIRSHPAQVRRADHFKAAPGTGARPADVSLQTEVMT